MMGLTGIIGSTGVYAVEYAGQSQTLSNTCGNGLFSTDISCQNRQVAIQGDDNVVTTQGHSSITDTFGSDPVENVNFPDSDVPPNDEDNQQPPTEGDNSVPPGDDQTPISPPNGASDPTISDPTLMVFPCCDEMLTPEGSLAFP
jgi:hypothetical protein